MTKYNSQSDIEKMLADIHSDRQNLLAQGHAINLKLDTLLEQDALGQRWANALAEIMGAAPMHETRPNNFITGDCYTIQGEDKRDYAVDPDYTTAAHIPPPNRVLRLGIKAKPSTETVSSDDSRDRNIDLWEEKFGTLGIQATSTKDLHGWYRMDIAITPDLPEKIETALVQIRAKKAEKDGEIKGDATRTTIEAGIRETVEKEIWGGLTQGQAR